MKKKTVALLLSGLMVYPQGVPVYAADTIPAEMTMNQETQNTEEVSSEEEGLSSESESEPVEEMDSHSEENISSGAEEETVTLPEEDQILTEETDTVPETDAAPESNVPANKEALDESNETAPQAEVHPFAIGETFLVDDITYEVTSSDAAHPEVAATNIDSFLTELNLPGSVAYEGVTYQVTSIPDHAFDGKSRLQIISLPEGLKTVGNTAFRFCSNVKELHLPSTLETFCTEGFESLETITLAEGNAAFQLIDGVLFSKDGTTLRLYPAMKGDESYVIPSGTTTLERGSFTYNKGLKHLILSNDVTTINDHALYQMQGLETFTGGENVSFFDNYNLYQCPNLRNVVLKGSFVIGNYSINDCPNLENISMEGNIQGHGAYALYDLPGLKAYSVNEENEYYTAIDGVLYNGTELLRYPSSKEGTTYVVPDQTTKIAALAFNYMQNTTEVILPQNVTLAAQAFNYPNVNSPITIYFRDTERISLSTSASGVFVALQEGSNLYFANEKTYQEFLAHSNAVNPQGSVHAEVKKIPVQNITFHESAKELKPHKSFTLIPEITPYYYSEDVTWSTSNPDVATVENGVVTTVGYGDCQIMLTSASGVKAVCDLSVVQTDINQVDFSKVESHPYTGSPIEPKIILSDEGYALKEGVDYTVSYSDNTNVGMGKLTVTGKGDYKGTKEIAFQIAPKDFRTVTIKKLSNQEYTGEAITPNVTVKDGDITLKKGTDYTVSYQNNFNAGKAIVTIEGKGNYAGSQEVSFQIEAKSMDKVTLSDIEAQEYCGLALTPDFTVSDGKITLKKDTDYTVTYQNNVNVGTATILVEGKGNYTGSKEISFKIKQRGMDKVTLSDIADQEYSGTALTPDFVVSDGDLTLKKNTDYTVEYQDNVNAGTATVTVKGKGNYTGSKKVTFKINEKDINKAVITDVDDQIFSGETITPEVVIKDGKETLKEGRDYTVSYKDNLNIGTATITVKGKGNYTGSKKLSFKIGAKHIKEVSVSDIADQIFSGEAFTPEVVVTDGNKTLVKDQDYFVSYYDNENAGTAKVIITGTGNYVGEKEASFIIQAKAMDSVMLSEIAAHTYTGEAFTPEVIVTDGEKELAKDTDYTVKYQNNVNAGTATVIVEGKGNYAGKKETSFLIEAKAMESLTVREIAAVEYDGAAQTPEIVVTDGDQPLVKDTDYTVEYQNNVNAGTATVIVEGKGNYQGTKSTTFDIHAKEFAQLSDITVEDQLYTGEALTPEVVVKDGDKQLVQDTDYTVEYQNNTEMGTATVILTGIGNYTGSKSVSFRIGKSMEQVSVGEIAAVEYDGAAQTPEIVVTDGDQQLVKDTDYTVEYQNNVNAGTATVIVEGKGYYIGKKEVTFQIEAKAMESLTVGEIAAVEYHGAAQTPEVVVTDGDKQLVKDTDYTVEYQNNVNAGTATVIVEGKGNYQGTKSTTFDIRAKEFGQLSDITVEDQLYTGEALTPEVVVKDGDKQLVQDTDYTVEYQNNTEMGTATVILTGIGNYTGSKNVSFRIGKSMEHVSVGEIAAQSYSGSEITPDVVVTDGEKQLVKDTDYTVEYQNNMNAGTATVLVKGIGNYVGTKEISFEILAKSIEGVQISPIEVQKYTGEALTPDVVLTDGDYTLVLDQDYTVTYADNINVGKATVEITGIGNYEGKISASFHIEETVPDHSTGTDPEEKPNLPKDEKPGSKNETPVSKDQKEVPETSDMAQPFGYSILLGLSGLGSALAFFKKKNRKKK